MEVMNLKKKNDGEEKEDINRLGGESAGIKIRD